MIIRIRTQLRSLRIFGARPRFLVSLPLGLVLSASLLASPPLNPTSDGTAAAPHHHRWFQTGRASWYGRAFQGKRTATGERFDMNALTCAHRTLPLGSWLRVTNLENRRSIFVRVNDRGPYISDTVVDLSYAAARKVGLLGKAPVRVEEFRADDPALAHALLAQNADDLQGGGRVVTP